MLNYWIYVGEIIGATLGATGLIYGGWVAYKKFQNRYYRRLESK